MQQAGPNMNENMQPAIPQAIFHPSPILNAQQITP